MTIETTGISAAISALSDFHNADVRTLVYGNGLEITGETFAVRNSHGDVKLLVDGKGNVVESYAYDAFGNPVSEYKSENAQTSKTGTSSLPENDILYAGEQYDSVTETYYLRARNYSPEQGRFTCEDDYHGDGRNLYVYVGSNPLRYTDPSGYCKKSAGDYLHELFGKIKEDEYLIPYYFITYSYGDSGLPCIGSAVGISYSTYNFPFIKTALAVRDDINDDIVDVVIEVAGDYLPSETLENAAIFFSNVSDVYEKMVTPLKKCADFFEWLTALSVPAIGETLTFGAPSLITPEGWVVEGGVAVSGTVVVLVEASGSAVFEAAAYGSQRNADKSIEISQKLRNKAEATKHGEQRLAERGFSQEKIDDIVNNYSQKVYQDGGRTVYAKKNGNYYDVIVTNSEGEIITAVGGNTKSLKTWKDVIRMLNNHGGYSSLPVD